MAGNKMFKASLYGHGQIYSTIEKAEQALAKFLFNTSKNSILYTDEAKERIKNLMSHENYKAIIIEYNNWIRTNPNDNDTAIIIKYEVDKPFSM